MFADMHIINKNIRYCIDSFKTQKETFAFPFRFYKQRFGIVTHSTIVILLAGKGIATVPSMGQVHPFFTFKLYLMGKTKHPVLVQQNFFTRSKG